jgi:DNA (cytosine-5)-methyltransferase 1
LNAYYNEHDPFAAQWLRNLADAGHVGPGRIDDRDIQFVAPADVARFRQCHFFAGIGGWSHALRLAGWPDEAEVWTGSCPCQPFSTAGRGGGVTDERHLWPEFFRLIRECRPPVIFGEQVASLDGLEWFDAVSSDVESVGYAIAAADLCAAGVRAPQLRQRLFFMAIARGERLEELRLRLLTRRSFEAGIEAPGRGEAGGVADVAGTGWREGIDAASSERTQYGIGSADDRGTGGAVASGEIGGRGSRRGCSPVPRGTESERAAQQSGGRGDDSRAMGHSDDSRLARRSHIDGNDGSQLAPAERAGGRVPWDDAEWIYCTDDKYRAVEPGTFPLAPGIPVGMGRSEPALRGMAKRARANRVGRLRGYGNAIVPEVAARFICAGIEALEGW